MKRVILQDFCCVLFSTSLLGSCHAYLAVHGSPGYTPGVGGYIVSVGTIDFINTRIAVNDVGTAVSSADRYDGSGNPIDHRALRWNSVGGDELGHLGTSGGLAFSSARAINESGDSVGDAAVGFGNSHAVRWNGSGTASTQLTLPIGYAGARLQDINASGTSLGIGFPTVAGGVHPIRWNNSGSPTVLPLPSGYPNAEAYAINDGGTSIGRAFTGVDDRAVRWDAAGTLAVLGHLGLDVNGNTILQPNALNSAGTVVGSAAKHDRMGNFLGTVPIRWEASGTSAVELDTLPPDPNSGFFFGSAQAINDNGVVVGAVYKSPSFPTDEFGTRAARWDAFGTSVTALGHLGIANGQAIANAYAINASGLIVGMASQYNPSKGILDFRAVFWNSAGIAIDLNSLIDPASGWELTHAYAVSDTGWIAGDGYYDPDGSGGQDPYGRHFLIQIPDNLSADFDHDGDVDGRDFLVWQRGGSPTPLSSTDLAAWQINYGASLTAAATEVPEPSGGLFLFIGSIQLQASLRRRYRRFNL